MDDCTSKPILPRTPPVSHGPGRHESGWKGGQEEFQRKVLHIIDDIITDQQVLADANSNERMPPISRTYSCIAYAQSTRTLRRSRPNRLPIVERVIASHVMIKESTSDFTVAELTGAKDYYIAMDGVDKIIIDFTAKRWNASATVVARTRSDGMDNPHTIRVSRPLAAIPRAGTTATNLAPTARVRRRRTRHHGTLTSSKTNSASRGVRLNATIRRLTPASPRRTPRRARIVPLATRSTATNQAA